jgi:hypothetical protein
VIPQPDPGQHGRHLLTQLLGVAPFALDYDDEVVGVADQTVGRLAVVAALGPLVGRAHRLVPLLGEMIIQDGQGDVGQQRGQDPALRGPGQ